MPELDGNKTNQSRDEKGKKRRKPGSGDKRWPRPSAGALFHNASTLVPSEQTAQAGENA
jgi:hypothetical protein